jgi:hypothetical protein
VPAVLTTASSVSCDHAPPGSGKLTLDAAATGVLKVDGTTVLSGTLMGAPIGSGCTQTGSPGLVPCTAVMAQTGGTSTVLKANGSPVLLDTASGATNGVPDTKWSVKDAAQTVLTAA